MSASELSDSDSANISASPPAFHLFDAHGRRIDLDPTTASHLQTWLQEHGYLPPDSSHDAPLTLTPLPPASSDAQVTLPIPGALVEKGEETDEFVRFYRIGRMCYHGDTRILVWPDGSPMTSCTEADFPLLRTERVMLKSADVIRFVEDVIADDESSEAERAGSITGYLAACFEDFYSPVDPVQ